MKVPLTRHANCWLPRVCTTPFQRHITTIGGVADRGHQDDVLMVSLAACPALWALLPWSRREWLLEQNPTILFGGPAANIGWQKSWLPFGLPPPASAPSFLSGTAWCRYLLGLGYRPTQSWGYGTGAFRCTSRSFHLPYSPHRGYATQAQGGIHLLKGVLPYRLPLSHQHITTPCA